MPKNKNRVTIAEVSRAARKLQQEKDGERIISGISGRALSEFALNFEDQYSERQSQLGSAPKTKQGIMVAAEKILAESPDLIARAIWDKLTACDSHDPYEVNHEWGVYGDGKYLVQVSFETAKSGKILFSTFEKSYVRVARKKITES